MSSGDCTLLRPGVSIRPVVTEDVIKEILSEAYGLKCLSIKQLNGYDDNNYHVKIEEICDNKYIENLHEDGYILKVINSLDSEKPQFFEAQSELLIYLGKAGICCPKPIPNKTGQYYFTKVLSSGRHIVRLLEYITGSILHQVPTSPNLFFDCGKFVANLDETLKDFHHSAYDNHKTIWHHESIPQLPQFLFAVPDESKRKILKSVIDEFTEKVLPVSRKLERGIIHGDFNEQNVLVEERDGAWRVKGILDFGDSHCACYLYELAITMAYMMMEGKSLEAGGYVLAGYQSVRKLPTQELNLLKICIAGRLSQSLLLGAYSSLQDPDNSYILTTSKLGWTILNELWTKPNDELLQYWGEIVRSKNDKNE